MDTEFQRRVTIEAAAHACLAVGATRAHPALLETLADVVKHFVATLGAHAHAVAEHGGRADVNVLDMLAAMKQMGPEAVFLAIAHARACVQALF
jgi:histone H3/H4